MQPCCIDLNPGPFARMMFNYQQSLKLCVSAEFPVYGGTSALTVLGSNSTVFVADVIGVTT